MKSRTFLAASILTGLSLGLLGCEGEAMKVEPKPAETPVAKPGPAAEPGPVQPSPTPSLPTPGAPDMKKDEPKAEMKKDEPKAEMKKDEPKLETPK